MPLLRTKTLERAPDDHGGAEDQGEKSTLFATDREVSERARRAELGILAEEIASLVYRIEDQKQRSVMSFEVASVALHFRRTKQTIAEALALLERQGKATPCNLPGLWALPRLKSNAQRSATLDGNA